MTNQEIFDTVATHLLTQMKQSMGMTSNGVIICKYRGGNGTSCAVGCLIPDELYDPAIEGLNVLAVSWPSAIKHAIIGDGPNPWVALNLLSRLQEVHDGREPAHWKSALHELAGVFMLNTEILEKFN